jgi:hypothetical protein
MSALIGKGGNKSRIIEVLTEVVGVAPTFAKIPAVDTNNTRESSGLIVPGQSIVNEYRIPTDQGDSRLTYYNDQPSLSLTGGFCIVVDLDITDTVTGDSRVIGNRQHITSNFFEIFANSAGSFRFSIGGVAARTEVFTGSVDPGSYFLVLNWVSTGSSSLSVNGSLYTRSIFTAGNSLAVGPANNITLGNIGDGGTRISRSLACNIRMAAIFNQVISTPAALLQQAEDDILRAAIRRPGVYFDFGGGSEYVTLTGANATQSNTSSTGAISQTHVITAANATQSNTSTTGAIITDNTVSLTGAHATQVNNSTTGAISQTHVLTGANATQANTSSTGAISTDGTVTLTGAHATQTNSSSTGAITQTHLLTGIGSTQVNNSSVGAIIVAGTIVLTGANAAQTNSSSIGAISQRHVLTGAHATQTNSSTTGAIGFPGQLNPSVHESHVKTYADAEAVTLLSAHEPITILAINDTIRTYQ